jgi:hypothetical protein
MAGEVSTSDAGAGAHLEEAEEVQVKWTDFMSPQEEQALRLLQLELIALGDSRDRIEEFNRLTSCGRLSPAHYVCWEEMMDKLWEIKMAMKAYIKANPHPF